MASTVARAEKDRIRILQVVNQISTGGTEYAMLNLMSALGTEDFDFRICAMRGCDPEFPRMPMVAGRLFVAGENDGKLQMPLPRLIRLMKAYRPHIVHSRNWGSIESVFAARFAGVPVAIHSEHGYEIETLKGLPRRQRLFRRIAYSLADAVFTVSYELREYHARQAWLAPERIRVIYNGVDTQRFSPNPEIRQQIRGQLSLPLSRIVIGTVGRMVPIKDQGTLLKAAETLIARGLDIYLLLVGNGPQLSKLDAYARASPALSSRVRFVGRSENVRELLNAMDIFVLPSVCEGISNTLLEAMASGLPVVATDVGGNKEVVEQDRNGCFFTPGNPDELGERLQLLLENGDLLRAWGAAGRARAISHFSLERMAKEYRDLYLTLAHRNVAFVKSPMQSDPIASE